MNLDTFILMIALAANKLFMRSKVNNNAILIYVMIELVTNKFFMK
jgi:hypothetical protein